MIASDIRHARHVVFIAACFIAAGCGASSMATSTSPSPALVRNCVAQTATAFSGPTPGAAHYEGMTVDGFQRDYRVYEPSSMAGSNRVPLVFLLHPMPADAAQSASVTGLDDVAAREGFLMVYPDGCDEAWDFARGSFDVHFIDRLLSKLESEYPVDPARIYVAGFSAGAAMAYRIACDLSTRVTAIAADAGMMSWDDCHPAVPISVFGLHGTADQSTESITEPIIDGWASFDGCTGSPAQSQTGITQTKLWSNCSDGVVVRLDTVIGGNHTWFGTNYDSVPGEPDANSLVWGFFANLHR